MTTGFRRSLVPWLAILALALALAPAPPSAAAPLQAEESTERRDAQRSIDRYRDYLARKPFHDWAFDKMVEAAVQINALGDLVADYEAQVAEHDDDVGARVVLGRLYARADQEDKALEVLSAIEDPGAGLLRLLGDLHLGRNEPKLAAEALERAAAATEDLELLREIHKSRGEALLASGDRERAAEAIRTLAELDPDSFHTRLEVATELARHGLDDEAGEEFAAAEELAGDDTAKRCRVLAEIGRLHERRLRGEEALAVYDRAIGLMARGNWLKRDLYGRVLALHKRAGTLEQLIETQTALVEENGQDLDGREFLARVLIDAARREEARTVLEAAAVDFPDDLKLSRSLIELLAEIEDDDARIAEYQRAIERHPEELDLYLELGQVFASTGRSEQAKLQWQRSLERRLSDVGLCLRLAELYARYDLVDEAVGLYEKAIELQPGDMGSYSDLAAYLKRLGREDQVPDLLERAGEAADGQANTLESVGLLWREYGQPERALEFLERALELKGDDARLFTNLADLLVELGRIDQAAERLHGAINLASDPLTRNAAVDRVIRLFRKNERLEDLVAREVAAVEAGSADPAPYLILGKVYVQDRQPGPAMEVYEALLEVEADQEDARLQLARLHEEAGDYGTALEQYQHLIDAAPKNRRKHLKQMARIYLTLYDQERAFACYEDILRTSPDNPAAFKEVAEAYARLGLHDKAAECLQQAVRLKPEDGEYRLILAKTYRSLGEPDKARTEILAAARSDDEEVREDARADFYGLLREEGRVDDEVDALRGRVQDNPYDVEASLTLTDLYVRELEYQLALEMMEQLLQYQPREARLLAERARVLGLMDRHEEAIADLETLWKLPDADRDSIAVKIGGAAIQAGDLERAGAALAPVHDRMRVARLYLKHDLFDEALAALEEGIAAAPTDAALHRRLASVKARMGDRAGAAEAYERVLAIEGDSMRTITWLGDLYHQMGRREEAVDCGRRLFALIRVPEEDVEDEEDAAPGNRIRLGGTSFGAADANSYGRMLGQVQSYFTDKNYLEEFGDLAEAELERQPSNAELFRRVMTHFRNTKKDVLRATGIVERVRTATVERDLTPPTYTPAGWREYLDSQRMSLYGADHAVAGERAAALAAELEQDGTSSGAADWVELAQLQAMTRQEAESRATLERALELFPEAERLLSGYAQRLMLDEDYAAAAEAFGRLATLLRETFDDGEEKARRELAFRRSRQAYQQSFPWTVRRQVTDADLQRLAGVQSSPSWRVAEGLGRRSTWQGAVLQRARALVKLERKDEALAVLAELYPADPEDPRAVGEWVQIGSFLYGEEFYDEAREVYARLAESEARIEADPMLGLVDTWRTRFNVALRNLGRIHERSGDLLSAYDMIRTYEGARPAELLLTSNELFDEAEALYRERFGAAAAELEAGATPAARHAFRDAGVRLAEVLQFQKRWDEAMTVYSEVAARLPEEYAVREVMASLHERRGDFEAAVAMHEEIIANKRLANRKLHKVAETKRRTLAPSVPPRAVGGDNDWVWQNLSYTWRYGGTRGRVSFTQNYTAILRIYLDRRMTSKAAEVMMQLAREDVSSFGWMTYSLRELIDNYQLGAKGVPILRLLYAHSPDDQNTALSYGKALVAAKQLEEAQRVLTALVNRPGVSSYYRDRAREDLDRVEAKLGLEAGNSLEDLRTAVAEDPKNVKNRTRLARRLFEDRAYGEAFEQAAAAEELAPHLEDVKTLRADCLRALGRFDELRAQLEQEVELLPEGEERFLAAVELANHMWADGDLDQVQAMLDRAKVNGSSGDNYSSAAWFLEKGEYDTAGRILGEEIEEAGQNNWYEDQMRQRLAKLYLVRGDLAGVLDLAWERYGEASGFGAKQTHFGNLVQTLRLAPDPGANHAAVLDAAAGYEGPRGYLTRAAAGLAVADLDLAADQLERLLAADPEELWPYPILIGIDRVRGDLEGALARMRRLEEINPGSDANRVSTTIGYVTERDAFRAEMGTILLRLGRADEARETWGAIFDPSQASSRRALASLYRENELYGDAVEMMEGYIEKQGERSSGDLQFLADLYIRVGRAEEALEAYEKALVLSMDDEGSRKNLRQRILDVHRRLGDLEAYHADLKARGEADPDDVELWLEVARVATELGDDHGARAALERVADKAGVEAVVLPVLADLHRAEGRYAEAADTLERLLGASLDTWERSRRAESLAELLFELDRDEEALEALRRGQEDPDSRAARRSIGRFLATRGYDELALEQYRSVLEEDPDDHSLRSTVASILADLERFDEAAEELFGYLDSVDGQTRMMGQRTLGLRITDALGGAEAFPVPPEGDPEEAAGLRRAAAVRAWYHDPACFALFDRMLARDPEDLGAVSGGYQTALALGDDPRALAYGPLYRDLLERENLAAGRYRSELNSWQRSFGSLVLRSGDPEGALRIWREPVVKRQRDVRIYRYTHYNEPETTARTYAGFVRTHGLEDHILTSAAEASYFGYRYNQPGTSYPEMLARQGQTERALELLWREIVDPTAGLVQLVSSARYFFSPFEESNNWAYGPLLRLYREQDREAELRARLEEARSRHPEHKGLEGLHRFLLHADEDWEASLALVEEDLADAPFDVDLLERKAGYLIALKRFDEAIGVQTEVQRMRRGEGGGYREYTLGGVGGGAVIQGVRFTWAGAQNASSTSVSSFYSSSWGDVGSAERRTLMALHAAAGDGEEARRLEAQELAAAVGNRAQVHLRLAHAYDNVDLSVEVERHCRRAVELDPEEFASSTASLLVRHYERLDDEEGLARALEQQLEAHGAAIERSPHDGGAYRRRGLLRLEHGLDLALARADLERSLELDPTSVASRRALAELALREGDPQAALQGVSEARDLARAQGQGWTEHANLTYTQGLAEAALDRPVQARPVLLKALALDPDNRRAEEARAVLQ